MRFQPIFFIIINKKYVDERIFMVTITSWKIVIEKSGKPVIYLRNDTYWYNQKRCPRSEDIVVTEEGIEFSCSPMTAILSSRTGRRLMLPPCWQSTVGSAGSLAVWTGRKRQAALSLRNEVQEWERKF